MSEFSITPQNENAEKATQIDAAKLEQIMRDVKSKQSLPMAILGGLLASVVAAIIWALITYATGYQIGFMAVGVGFLVGYAVNFFGKGYDISFGIIGAVLALFGCVLGNLLTVLIFASMTEGISVLNLFLGFLSSPGIVFQIMVDSFRAIDILFYALAIYQGYKLSFSDISEEDLGSLQKPVETPTKPTE